MNVPYTKSQLVKFSQRPSAPNWRAIKKEIESNDVVYVLAISGGVDSMALVDFFRRAECDMVVAHFNHHLQEINNDMETHVTSYCEEHSLFLYRSIGVNIKLNASMNHTSIEAEARTQRYRFLNRVCQAVGEQFNKKTVIVTGHHNDDQVETVLLNLFRGVSLDQLPMKRYDGNRFKPFLEISKAELIRTATSRKLTWVEDPTNLEVDADRNWLRNDIIPQIMERRNIKKTIPLSIKKFADKD